MVMAQSLFIDIKNRQPKAQIDVLAPAWTAALLDRMPQVSSLVEAPFSHGKLGLRSRIQLGKELRAQRYSHAIVLPNSWKSALVPMLAKIPNRVGFRGEQRWGLLTDIRKLNKQLLPMTVQRFVSLGRGISYSTSSSGDSSTESPVNDPINSVSDIRQIPPPALETTANDVAAVTSKNNLDTQSPVLVLCPGAEFGASKKWPVEKYAQVAEHYLDQNWNVWLMGSKSDQQSCHVINKRSGNRCQMLAGKTTLPEAIDLISCASLCVSNDSGLMHIAAALQVPLVAVYGSTDPSHTPPLSSNHAIARLALDCSPCFKRECPLHHLNCLNQLDANIVIDQATELLQ